MNKPFKSTTFPFSRNAAKTLKPSLKQSKPPVQTKEKKPEQPVETVDSKFNSASFFQEPEKTVEVNVLDEKVKKLECDMEGLKTDNASLLTLLKEKDEKEEVLQKENGSLTDELAVMNREFSQLLE